MTDELKKEAEVWIAEYTGIDIETQRAIKLRYHDNLRNAYLASAEPREKQIQIDAEQIRALQKQNGELTDKVKELEAQIEKMKCCQNCLHLCARCELGIDGCYVCSKWELRR